jgi:UDP-GlcNAc:undecaprenyl-phosphate/decaprenyl-phosphate GlcNAc-1-phosphate transferase
MNWFRASKNHIHHRLLQLGYHHYQAVVALYSIQTLFVVSAVFLRYESDLLVASLYLGVCMLVFSFLVVAERKKILVGVSDAKSRLSGMVTGGKGHRLVAGIPALIVSAAVPLYFVVGSVWVRHVSADFGGFATVLAVVLTVVFRWRDRPVPRIFLRVASYATAALLIYLIEKHGAEANPMLLNIEIGYFIFLAVAIAIAIRYGHDTEFKSTPMDFLVVFLVVAFGFLQQRAGEQTDLGSVLIKTVILFYGSEVIVNGLKKRWTDLLDVSVIAASGILAAKGLIFS